LVKALIAACACSNAYSVRLSNRLNDIASQSSALLAENSPMFHVFEDIQAFAFVISLQHGLSPQIDCCAGIPLDRLLTVFDLSAFKRACPLIR
jgi:hypothetical protein